MIPNFTEFQEERDRVRLELYAQFTTWADLLEEVSNPVQEAEAILEEMARLRNNSTSLPVDYNYFKTGVGFLKNVDIARYVLEGAKSDISWLGVVETLGDIEARLRYVCEQELATAGLIKVSNRKNTKKLEIKMCRLKGRFLVLWTALLRFRR